MSGYTKLFNSILASTIWREPNHVRLVWITMLAMKDARGIVEASIPGLADMARVSIDECEGALTTLRAPDPYSRTKDHEGRRIADVDGGFRILNHEKYRERMSAEDRKEYQRTYRACYRAEGRDKWRPVNSGQHLVNSGQQMSTGSIHSDTDSDSNTDQNILSGRPDDARRVERAELKEKAKTALCHLNDKAGKSFRETEDNLKLIAARLEEVSGDLPGVLQMIDRQCQLWLGTEMAEYLRPETLFGKKKFGSYYDNRNQPVQPRGGSRPTPQRPDDNANF